MFAFFFLVLLIVRMPLDGRLLRVWPRAFPTSRGHEFAAFGHDAPEKEQPHEVFREVRDASRAGVVRSRL